MKERAGRDDGPVPGRARRTAWVTSTTTCRPSQRKVVTPNNDTIYGAGFADLATTPW